VGVEVVLGEAVSPEAASGVAVAEVGNLIFWLNIPLLWNNPSNYLDKVFISYIL
jgi:hypothetical protein